MLTENSLKFIQEAATEFGATRVFLFGSCLGCLEQDADDIDIAVEGLSKSDYWDFWRRLLWSDELGGKSVDIVRIEDNGFLVPIILDEGMEIYAEGKPQVGALEHI
ncbi:MAG: nucleotidyltransferase domain-containing protein [Synergistaceae bacterium]|jgi:predicted nucleotidyltransferase|nr:nucleotidyltransferase domain-containing protein [Synergistaceae bacterium]